MQPRHDGLSVEMVSQPSCPADLYRYLEQQNMTHKIEDTKTIVTVSTNISCQCKHCKFHVGPETFDESVSHYVKEHGYTLLHVGSQADRDAQDGHSISHTVAILGRA